MKFEKSLDNYNCNSIFPCCIIMNYLHIDRIILLIFSVCLSPYIDTFKRILVSGQVLIFLNLFRPIYTFKLLILKAIFVSKHYFIIGSFLNISCLIDYMVQFSQLSCSVVSNSLWPHESQHARPPCPSPTPGVYSNSCPSSWWCHLAISSSVIPSPPASNPSQDQSLFQWVNSSHEVAKVLEFQL